MYSAHACVQSCLRIITAIFHKLFRIYYNLILKPHVEYNNIYLTQFITHFNNLKLFNCNSSISLFPFPEFVHSFNAVIAL